MSDDVVLRGEDRMKCPTCGEQNAIDMATCINCGHELELRTNKVDIKWEKKSIMVTGVALIAIGSIFRVIILTSANPSDFITILDLLNICKAIGIFLVIMWACKKSFIKWIISQFKGFATANIRGGNMRGEGWESGEDRRHTPKNESGGTRPKYPTWSERYTKWSESRREEASALSVKTMKELNKELNEKKWYRLLKILWLFFYLILLFSGLASNRTKTSTDALIFFLLLTFSYLGAAIALKRAICYAADYVTTGRIYLKEKWYSLLFIVLWGIPSIIEIIIFFIKTFMASPHPMIR